MLSQLYTGWWLTYPSEKYAQVSWDDEIPYIWKVIIHSCSKPPTRWYDYYPNIYFTTFPHRFSQSLQCILHPEMESSIFSHLFTKFPLKEWQMIWLWRIWYEYIMISYQISWILSQHVSPTFSQPSPQQPASAAPRCPVPPSPPLPTTSSPWPTAPGRAARRWPCDHWTPQGRVAPCGDGGHGWNVFKMVKHMVNISGWWFQPSWKIWVHHI